MEFPLLIIGLYILAGFIVIQWLLGIKYIPHDRVGIIEKLWSIRGSLTEGKIIAVNGEAGFQADILRGGLHFFFFPWQYRIHTVPLVMIAESKIGYVYARDGIPLPPTQTLARVTKCNDFQDAASFLTCEGQRGRQRAILREGVYALNLALFVIITEDGVHSGPIRDPNQDKFFQWQTQLAEMGGFDPVIIGHRGQRLNQQQAPEIGNVDKTLNPSDTIGIVTVHDGPPIESGEIIAPEVKASDGDDHDYFQDPEIFLNLGGRRGKQLQVLTDGTFFINRWFATIEIKPKTLIPIGFVGVVVSYYGNKGKDTTGEEFRYGEQVEPGERGVWKRALTPGKYPLNPYAVKVELVPTVNFVLRWITGQAEAHQYDKELMSIELITTDGYEPVLPLSIILHIDYEMAPSVIQRFGDIKRLISQTLDPILSAYFRDVAQRINMLELLTKRDEIQKHATDELGRRFREYDINCVAVLIGRPESKIEADIGQQDAIESLFDQLRMRRLAAEQMETFLKQEEAQKKLKDLKDATAAAEKQAELTQTKIDVEISANRGEAQLAESRRLAKRDIAMAFGESRARELMGRGEASKIAQIGMSEAAVFLQKIRAYGDPRLFALNLVSEHFAKSSQPIVPERLLMMGAGTDGKDSDSGMNVFNRLITLLLTEKAGIGLTGQPETATDLEKMADELAKKFMNRLGEKTDTGSFETEMEEAMKENKVE